MTVNQGSGDLTRHTGFVNVGSGFESMASISAGLDPAALAVGDLNGDKTPYIQVVNKAEADLTILLEAPQAQSLAFGTGCA